MHVDSLRAHERMTERKPLYDESMAECLAVRETMRDDGTKYGLLLENLGECSRLVDIGCGWGQFLALAAELVDEVWGVDECADRVVDVRKACPAAKVVVCRADRIDLPDAYFDTAVTSQMLHEAKLFGDEGELEGTLAEIRRLLRDGGRYLLLDHQDAGEGDVIVRLPADQIARLGEFERNYEFYEASHESLPDGTIRISRRCLQDSLSKDWSLGSAMESIEMRETHNVFEQAATTALVESAGFRVTQRIGFSDITVDLQRHGGAMVEGESWFRKFVLVADRA